MTESDRPATPPLQPLLHDRVVAYSAPAQVWSGPDGDVGDAAIDGVYVGDVRVIAEQRIRIDGVAGEHVRTSVDDARTVRFISLQRHLDGPGADPDVRSTHTRTTRADGVDERVTLASRRAEPQPVRITVSLRVDAASMDAVKAGGTDASAAALHPTDDGVDWGTDAVTAHLQARDATVTTDGDAIALAWQVVLPARGSVEVSWSIRARDALAVVAAPVAAAGWSTPTVSTGDQRLARWVERALGDLDALRLETTRMPGEQFLAAGAPWFFTLFGRDSIWAARFLLPLGTGVAASTLRVLAGLQGTTSDIDTAEQPGKIMHELRRTQLEIPGEGVSLPPLYYGTVDATALWVCLLHDAWRWGMADDEVRALVPHLEAALAWMRDSGDSDGDGLLEYVDESGRGLSNQGWKDSGDSVQWRDGSLAGGPIALCEVQAYAYEAAIHGADLLDAFGGDGAEWRTWAARLRARFHETFWVDDPEGSYPAIALDADKRAVDTVTSNLGHLLGTGLLDDRQSALVARRLGSPTMDSGFGLRTLAEGSGGYWPLGYHGGSVWTHDTAIAIHGLVRAGHRREADSLIRGLLAAAESFDYRMPELHAGDAASEVSAPVPYPAACRPQAWSAAAAVSVLGSALGLDADADGLRVAPTDVVGSISLDGASFGAHAFSLAVDDDGEVTRLDGAIATVG